MARPEAWAYEILGGTGSPPDMMGVMEGNEEEEEEETFEVLVIVLLSRVRKVEEDRILNWGWVEREREIEGDEDGVNECIIGRGHYTNLK